MRVYFDSDAMVYLVEQVAPWAARIQSRLMANPIRIAFSDLTGMECRVKPLTQRNAAILQDFDTTFASCELVPLDRAVFDRAADIRAQFGFKTPDALHLAAAVEAGCDAFLTNDGRLSRFPDIPVELI